MLAELPAGVVVLELDEVARLPPELLVIAEMLVAVDLSEFERAVVGDVRRETVSSVVAESKTPLDVRSELVVPAISALERLNVCERVVAPFVDETLILVPLELVAALVNSPEYCELTVAEPGRLECEPLEIAEPAALVRDAALTEIDASDEPKLEV